jgi:hypothetical protein
MILWKSRSRSGISVSIQDQWPVKEGANSQFSFKNPKKVKNQRLNLNFSPTFAVQNLKVRNAYYTAISS